MLKKSNTQAVLELLFIFPTKRFHVRELARLAEVSPPTASCIAGELAKEGIVIMESTPVVSEIKANQSNQAFLQLKRIHNISSLSPLIEHLEKEIVSEAIILFGSYSKGEDSENSDIDLCVIGNERNLKLDSFEKALKRRVSIIFISPKRLSDYRTKNPELLNNIINGVVLSGYLKVF